MRLHELFYQSFPCSFSNLGFNGFTLIVVILFGILIAITISDIKTMTIPPMYNVAILILGIISIFVVPQVGLPSRLVGAVCVSLPMFLIACVIPGGFGGGDMKLMAAAGFLLGFRTILVSFMIGLLLGGIYGIVLLIFKLKKKNDHFAFGPFLCIGLVVGIFATDYLISGYFGLADKMYYLL